MGVIDAILTASKLVASLSQTATNGTAFIIFSSQEEIEIDVQIRKKRAWDFECTPRGRFPDQ